jgi:hypothetical protein
MTFAISETMRTFEEDKESISGTSDRLVLEYKQLCEQMESTIDNNRFLEIQLELERLMEKIKAIKNLNKSKHGLSHT